MPDNKQRQVYNLPHDAYANDTMRAEMTIRHRASGFWHPAS